MELNTFTKLLTAVSLSFALTSCGSEDSDARVVIGIADTIISTNGLQYQYPIVIQVADSNGAPQANTQVTMSLKTISYFKGTYAFDNDIDGDTVPDQWGRTITATCLAEQDANNDGVLTLVTEDINSNTRLDPDTPSITQHPTEQATLLSGSATLVTDSNGFGYFALSYPSSEALWVTVELTATAQDSLPQNKGIETFTLPVATDDINDLANEPPGGLVSPYGQSTVCTDSA